MVARRTVQYPSGWTCELVVLRLEHYFLGTIPLDGALAVAEHLEACESCAQHFVLRYPVPLPRSPGDRRG
jgi:hypothetical protein